MLRVASTWSLTRWTVTGLTLAALTPTSDSASGMPRDERQEVRVLTATFKPGDKTVFHTHRFPVTVYMLEGGFTLEMEGRAPV